MADGGFGFDTSSLDPAAQAELSKLLRNRRLAEAFQQRALGPSGPTEVIGGVAVKQSPLGALARLLAGGMAGSAATQADTGIQGIGRQAAEAQSAETKSLMGMTPIARISAAMASRNPQIRKMAETWQKMQGDAAIAAGKVAGDMGDTSGAMNIFASGQIPGDYQAPPPTPVEFGMQGENPYAIETNRKGEKSVKFGPLRQTTEIKIPGKEADTSLEFFKDQIKGRQEEAKFALSTLSANRSALEALNQGAQAGGGEGFKQSVRKVAQAFGVQDAATAPTDKLVMALGNNILANARKLAPVTAEDIVRLEKILGSVNTDPTALIEALSVYNALAYKSLQDFQGFLKEGTSGLKTPYAADLFKTAGIGLEIPTEVPGTAAQQLRMLEELKKRGGDISAFAGPGGEPLSPDTQFDISGQGLLPPGLKDTNPRAIPTTPLSPAEQQELLDLRKRLGLTK